MTNDDIAAMLAAYEAEHGPPSGRADILAAALDVDQPVTHRGDLPVHVTCSMVAVNTSNKVLQVHHPVLDRWLFPGGHLEPHDATLTAAAVRELTDPRGRRCGRGGWACHRRAHVPADSGGGVAHSGRHCGAGGRLAGQCLVGTPQARSR